MSEIDELDINPFFRALQSKFLADYEKAQEECNMICIPHSMSLQGVFITRKFVDTHILKPSPFFKGQFLTQRPSKQTVSLSDDGDFLCTDEGFPTKVKVRIINEELGYNKDYKPYKMLVIERPLDQNVLRRQSLESSQSGEFKINYCLKECAEFLQSYADFSKHLKRLDEEIRRFNTNYILLADYLHDAMQRLHDITSTMSEQCIQSLPEKRLAKHRFKDIVNTSVETYTLGSVHQKLYPVICSKFSHEDSVMGDKCQRLHGLTPDQLGVSRHFCCALPTSVVELAHLGGLITPIEKLYCLKSTIDSMTEEISKRVEQSQPPGTTRDEMPCLTPDDVIPILVTVIVQAKCSHINSDIYHMENFYWSDTTKDRDNLSYCLVTFKAAVQFMMSSKFDDDELSKHLEKNEISFQDLMNRRLEVEKASTQKSTDSKPSRLPAKSRLDRQLENITKMLEETGTDTKKTRSKAGPQKISSVFGDSVSSYPATNNGLISESKPADQKDQMGDFLSSLQQDMFLSFGKQT